jgi:hypothetical protein
MSITRFKWYPEKTLSGVLHKGVLREISQSSCLRENVVEVLGKRLSVGSDGRCGGTVCGRREDAFLLGGELLS